MMGEVAVFYETGSKKIAFMALFCIGALSPQHNAIVVFHRDVMKLNRVFFRRASPGGAVEADFARKVD